MPFSLWVRIPGRWSLRHTANHTANCGKNKLFFGDDKVTFREDSGAGAPLPTRPRVDPLKVTVPMARSVEEWRSSASTRTPLDWEDHTSTPL